MLFSQKIYKTIDDGGQISKIKISNGFAGINYELTEESKNIL